MSHRIHLADKTMTDAPLVGLYVGSIFFAMFYYAPCMMLGFESDLGVILWLVPLVIEAFRAIWFFGFVLHRRNPIAALHFRDIVMGPRVFYPGAMIALVAANVDLLALVPVALLWLYTEAEAARGARQMPARQVLSGLRRSGALQKGSDGWIYRLDNGHNSIFDKTPAGHRVQIIARFVGLPFAMLGGGLFFVSFGLRDDFDLRLLIIAFVAVILGTITYQLLTMNRASRIALRMMRDGPT
jgi:hypothetical protein